MEQPRFYGHDHDRAAGIETLVEATRDADGTLHLVAVIVETGPEDTDR
jgi:hypothetical protein